ncbi:MAG: ImmA/IrrE family metallo-endopeptidase [Rhizomicrobium sp.]
MDEFAVVMKARELINKVGPTTIPAPIGSYVEQIGAVLRVRHDLEENEPGFSFENGGEHFICVNGKDSEERQKFTACHEIAHIVLGLPSDHSGLPWWSYAKRPLNEIFCDVFAAELLLPYKLFKPLVDRADISLSVVDGLSERFEASRTATGSRFAAVAAAPCAFVLSEQGKVRYASRSPTFRDARAWIAPQMALPEGSMSARIRLGSISDGPGEVPADLWLSDWRRGGVLLEDARHLARWDQTITLLWFEDEEVPEPTLDRRDREEEEFGLAELDGILPWPGRRRRR